MPPLRCALVGFAALASVATASDCCWCDEATPEESQSTLGYYDSAKYDLVFSDEFNSGGRDFANGKDAKWTALDIGDTSNQGAAFYLPSQASVQVDKNVTGPPVSALLILTENASHTGNSPTGETGVHMPYRSAMLQTWNKFCFTGGIVEFRARQPRGGGYWPALWLFGNLGRAVYQNSNTGLWPWSYDQCDDSLVLPPFDPPQRISACDDHDLEEEGLHPFQGRGATELDVLEGAVTNDGAASYVVGSLQLSPGIPSYFRPPLFGFPTESGAGSWYTGLTFGTGGTDHTDGFPNNGWYGPPWGAPCPTGCPDALSGGFVHLDDLDTTYWTYRMEWITGPSGHLSWHYNGNFVWAMAADSFGAYEVCSDRAGHKECTRTPARQIPEEPMSLVMNTAIGTWNGGKNAIDGKHWPAKFWVDYVRVWQKEMHVGCNPPNYPTRAYIEKHAEWYGEPVSPLGYDTCPEIYPPSAHEHAKQIGLRAQAERKLRAGVAVSASDATSTPAPAQTRSATAAASALFTPTSLYASGRGPALLSASSPTQHVSAAGARGATGEPVVTEARSGLSSGLVGLCVLAVGALVAWQAVVRVRSATAGSGSGIADVPPAEIEYESYGHYAPVS